MKRVAAVALTILELTIPAARAVAAEATPEFREVYEVLRTNLAGLTESELNQAAVAGLLAELRGRASWVGADASSTNPALAKFSVFERNIAFARVGQLNAQLAGELAANFRASAVTNKIKGFVLDLRFVAGDDYAAAAVMAELFIAKDRELFDWGNGVVKSSLEEVVIDVPVAVLVNRETIGSPEALAGVLRENSVALVLGGVTAGRALAGREYGLSNGRRLRVASTPVRLADGSEIPASGLKPDIVVPVSLEQEKLLMGEPYGPVVSAAATSISTAGSRPARSRRPSEADLVRERRENTNQLDAAPVREVPPDKPVILDPVLARAIDMLKGLAVVRGNRL